MKLEVEVDLTPHQLAESFTEMDNRLQATFFAQCGDAFASWERFDGKSVTLGAQTQILSIAEALCDPEHGSEAGRQMVLDLADFLREEMVKRTMSE